MYFLLYAYITCSDPYPKLEINIITDSTLVKLNST